MKPLYLAILIFHFFVSMTAQAQWVNVSFNKPEELVEFSFIYFKNKDLGSVSTAPKSNQIESYTYTTILGEKNLERLWQPYLISGSSVKIYDNLFAFPVTNSNWVKSFGEQFYISLDSQKTWKAVLTQTSFGMISKMVFPKEEHGFAFSVLNVAIIKTIDGGHSWQPCGKLGKIDLFSYLDISFPSSNIGYVVGKNSTLTKTINGGNTWVNLSVPFGSFQFNGIDFINETEGIIVGEAGKIFKTTNGGKTWKDYSIKGSSPALTAIDYVTPTLAYTCGYGGVIYQTTNAGKDWQLMESGTNNDLLAISFVDSTLGHCSGARSTILRLDNSPAPKIIKLQANKSLYCEGDSAIINYVANKRFDPSNFFVLQLSDGLGRFNQATELLRWNGDTSGVVKIKLPTGLATDQNYRFRIYSTETESPSVANDSSIQINRSAVATVGMDLQPGTKLCEGESATFTARPQYGGDKPTYNWFVNDKQVANTSTYSYRPLNQDKVYVVMTSNSNCVSTSVANSQTTVMTVNPVLTRPFISGDGMKLVSSASVGNQWFSNGTALKDSTRQSITPKIESMYSVRVTVNGCTSPMSALFQLIVATEEEQGNVQSLTLYPNPTNAILQIRTSLQIIKLVVYQSNGTKVLESRAIESLDVSALPDGLYLLEAWDINGKRTVKKFEKR